MSESKVAIIIGMHRSGTSCLTGMLEESGVFLGDISRKNPFNQRGNCENKRIMDLHDNLLADNGGSWDNPPKFVCWRDNHKKERDMIIKAYENSPYWGFKDPRTLFALEGWMEALPSSNLVGTFRNPLLVAKSLAARNGFSLEKGLSLWNIYNKLLLDFQSQYGFPLISFDEAKEIYVEKVARALALIGLNPPINGFVFFDVELRNSTENTRIAIPSESASIYRHLQECSL